MIVGCGKQHAALNCRVLRRAGWKHSNKRRFNVVGRTKARERLKKKQPDFSVIYNMARVETL